MDGLELAIRFSWQPNALCYCGPQDANQEFVRYLSSRGNERAVRNAIKGFEGLYPYLSCIADKTGKDFLDPDVVLGYWLGNEYTMDMGPDDCLAVMEDLVARGLPGSLADRLRADMPDGAVPTHAYHVLYVGPGNTTGTVEPTIPTKDNCLITPARVVSVGANLTVKRKPLMMTDGRLAFGPEDTFTVHYIPEMLSVRPGDHIAVHWGFGCMRLDDKLGSQLTENNDRAVAMMNQVLADSA